MQILILAEGLKIVFFGISGRESSLVQTFCESCVHLDITHPSVHMTQEICDSRLSYLKRNSPICTPTSDHWNAYHTATGTFYFFMQNYYWSAMNLLCQITPQYTVHEYLLNMIALM